MIKILLTDKDMEYGRALAAAVSGLHNEFEITLIPSEDRELLFEIIRSESHDLLLFGGLSREEILSFPFCAQQNRSVVLLCEDRVESIETQVRKQALSFWSLFKYVSVKEMISDLNFLYGFISGKKIFLRKSFHTQIIGIFSVCEDGTKSSVSVALARDLSRYHDKCILYLSFEELPAIGFFLKNPVNKRTIGDFLYYLLDRQNESLCSHLEAFVFRDEFGVEYFCDSNGINDLKSLTLDELHYVIKFLSDSCRYDFIILDLSTGLTEETKLLLESCFKIVMVENENPILAYKQRRLLAYLEEAVSTPAAERLIHAAVHRSGFSDQTITDNLREENSEIRKIDIEQDKSSFFITSEYMEINLNHSFGVGIKRLSEEILTTYSGKNTEKNVSYSECSVEGVSE